MKQIPLSQGKFAIVDDDDFERVSAIKWHYHIDGYAASTKTQMHRFILNAPKGMMVDHKNHNGLDNRKENIWICTNSQNQRNRNPRSTFPKQVKISKETAKEVRDFMATLPYRISFASMINQLIKWGITAIKRENNSQAGDCSESAMSK